MLRQADAVVGHDGEEPYGRLEQAVVEWDGERAGVARPHRVESLESLPFVDRAAPRFVVELEGDGQTEVDAAERRAIRTYSGDGVHLQTQCGRTHDPRNGAGDRPNGMRRARGENDGGGDASTAAHLDTGAVVHVDGLAVGQQQLSEARREGAVPPLVLKPVVLQLAQRGRLRDFGELANTIESALQ